MFRYVNILHFDLHLQMQIQVIIPLKKCEIQILQTKVAQIFAFLAFYRQAVERHKNTRVLKGLKTLIPLDFIGI